MEGYTTDNAVKEFIKFATNGSEVFRSFDNNYVPVSSNRNWIILISPMNCKKENRACVMWESVDTVDGNYIDEEISRTLFCIAREVCVEGLIYHVLNRGEFGEFIVDFEKSKRKEKVS